VLFGIAFDFFEAMNRIRLNISGAVFIKEVLFRLLVTLLIIGFGLKLYDFTALVSLLVFCYGIQAFSMAYIFLRRWDPDDSPLMPAKPSREQVKYMFLLFLGAGGTIIVNQIDSIMTGGMKGLDYAAVYAMAFFMSSVVYMPFRSVNSISSSVISAHFASGNMEALRNMYRSSSINLFLVGSIIFLGIWCNMDLIFSLIPEDKSSGLSFAEGKWVFFILGLSRLFDMLMGINGMILVNSRHYLWNILTMPLLAVVTIVTNLLLIPVMGINGAALASLISILIFNAVRFAVIWKKLDMQPFTHASAIALILFTLVLTASLLFSFSWAPAQLFFSFLLVGLGYALPAYFLKLSPELNDALLRIRSKIIGL
jgi:O-antigen/teichoic acid export membrane protein